MGMHGKLHALSVELDRVRTDLPSIRAIMHDPARYPDPEVFNPSRFLTADGALDPQVPDPTEAFGYGRRICPGRYLAQHVLCLTIANILSAFTIEKPVDKFGNIVEPSGEFASKVIRQVSVSSVR